MDDELTDDLFDEVDELAPGPSGQDGPDLFGAEPDELLLPVEPTPRDDPEVDLDQDSVDEIPIDPEEDQDEEGAEAPAAAASVPLAAPSSSVPDRVLQGEEAPRAPLALYRRYRPDTFAQLIGQEHVTEPLQRALVNNRVNHAYLFSGPRGCGKTTSARILARCLNCEQGPTPTPCGQCQSCRDLARGGTGSIDVIEIDAASHGGVDEARDLRERAFFAPVHSRYKIYIIDEAHMVTTQGFNALLKVVEEPPPHVKFIFATTEPDKVIGTIRSRTHHYPFRLVPPKTLSSYLATLCEQEGVAVDATVMPLVVRAGAGSVRDSLSVLDQLLGGAAEEGVTYHQATALLGYTPDSLLDEIVDAFAAGDAESVFASVDKVIEVGQDPRRFAEDLLRRLRDLIIVAAVPDALSSGLVDVAADQGERLTTQAAGLGAGELTRAAEVIAHGLTEMRGTTAPRLHLELMCARVLLPGADVDARGIHARLDRLERRLSIPAEGTDATERARSASASSPGVTASAQPGPASAQPGPASAQPGPASAQPGPASAQPAPAEAAPRAEAARGAQLAGAPDPASGGPASTSVPGQPAPSAMPADAPSGLQPPRPQGGEADGLSTADVRSMWPQVLDAVKNRRRVTWIILSQNAQVHSFDRDVLTLSVNNPGARESLGRGGSEDVLRESVLEVLGAAPAIEVVVGEPAPTPPPASRAPVGDTARRTGGGESAGWRSATEGRAAPDAEAAQPQTHERAAGGTDRLPDRAANPKPRRHHPATPPSPPPDDDDPPSGFAALARENVRQTQRTPAEPPPEVEPDRSDADLDAPGVEVDELLKNELGAELIAGDDGRTP